VTPGDSVRTYLAADRRSLFLNIYEDGELVAQPTLSPEQALELATEILTTAMVARRRAPLSGLTAVADVIELDSA
jgi:hypothetical protein